MVIRNKGVSLRAALSAYTAQALATRPVSAAIANAGLGTVMVSLSNHGAQGSGSCSNKLKNASILHHVIARDEAISHAKHD